MEQQITHKILLVEDEKNIRELYQRQLTLAGFTVTAVENGEKALQQLKEGTFDLMLLDIMLPGGLNGLQLLKEFKTLQPNSPMKVVITSNLGQDNVMKEGFALGAIAYLVKVTYKPDQIVAEVQKALNLPANNS